ncbi:MAG: shikimate kinase [Candidatus Latescibacterota bacterium]|nr:shikimate kinase [Candidatus Latescibacterota bacterium]
MDGDLSASTKGTCVSQDVVLIGPIGVGKSTQGRLLSQALSLPQCSMDQYRWDYYREIGYDEEFDQRLGAHVGFWGRYLYWKEFECHAVERLLSEQRDCVIDLGGGHSVYEIDTHFSRVRSALEPYRNVVLLLPSSDLDESVQILNERQGKSQSDEMDINEHFTRHHSNFDLAKFTVYTKDKTPEETRDEILAHMGP